MSSTTFTERLLDMYVSPERLDIVSKLITAERRMDEGTQHPSLGETGKGTVGAAPVRLRGLYQSVLN